MPRELPEDLEERIVTCSLMDFVKFYELNLNDYHLKRYWYELWGKINEMSIQKMYAETAKWMKESNAIAITDLIVTTTTIESYFTREFYGTAIRMKNPENPQCIHLAPEKDTAVKP